MSVYFLGECVSLITAYNFILCLIKKAGTHLYALHRTYSSFYFAKLDSVAVVLYLTVGTADVHNISVRPFISQISGFVYCITIGT